MKMTCGVARRAPGFGFSCVLRRTALASSGLEAAENQREFALGGTWRKQWTKQSFPPRKRGPGTEPLPSLDAGPPFRGIKGINAGCGREGVAGRQSVRCGEGTTPRG